MENRKKSSPTIRALETIFNESFYEVNSSYPSMDKSVAKTIKKDDGFYFEFAKMNLTSQKERRKIQFANEVSIEFSNIIEPPLRDNIPYDQKKKLRNRIVAHIFATDWLLK